MGDPSPGSAQGPWNHSLRLERILGRRLRVLGIVDPDLSRAQLKLQDKAHNPLISDCWIDAKVYPTIAEAKTALGDHTRLDFICNGCPPQFRGSDSPPRATDLQLMTHFKPRAMLIEKPLSTLDPREHLTSLLSTDEQLQRLCTTKATTIGVGYMLRYLTPIAKIKSIMDEHNLVPMSISARYFMAYELAVNVSWWNKATWGGPVVEQATHLIDLVRFLANQTPASNEAVLDSVRAHTVEYSDAAGKLRKLGFDEEGIIPEANRIPRCTSAIWKHRLGTVSNITHGVALHGDKYDTEVEVLADGWKFRVTDLYSPCPVLFIREPGVKEEVRVEYPNEDPFQTQFETIVGVVDRQRAQTAPNVATRYTEPLSTYSDALSTYLLSWQIRIASEREQQAAAQQQYTV